MRQGSPGSGWGGWLLGGETLLWASAIIYPKSVASRHVAPDRELQYFISLPVNQPCVGADGNIVWSLSDTLIISSPLIDTFTQQSAIHQQTAAAGSVCVRAHVYVHVLMVEARVSLLACVFLVVISIANGLRRGRKGEGGGEWVFCRNTGVSKPMTGKCVYKTTAGWREHLPNPLASC